MSDVAGRTKHETSLAMSSCDQLVAGNVFEKYKTTNPVYRYLVDRFIGGVAGIVRKRSPQRVLDVGCADGELASRVLFSGTVGRDDSYVGMDLSDEQVATAQSRFPGRTFVCGNACEIPYADKSFDMVMALEVLEHLDEPEKAMREITRVARNVVVVSVPWEPLWRVLNLCRLKYVLALGNTPGHKQHFSRTGIRNLVGRFCDIETDLRPIPWTILAGTPRE
jgi:ubiquinone/menaquinone biosynthesis C-methylase UbiE